MIKIKFPLRSNVTRQSKYVSTEIRTLNYLRREFCLTNLESIGRALREALLNSLRVRFRLRLSYEVAAQSRPIREIGMGRLRKTTLLWFGLARSRIMRQALNHTKFDLFCIVKGC